MASDLVSYKRCIEKVNDELDYICDDRIYESGGLLDQIRSMADEEFEKHIEELREKEQK